MTLAISSEMARLLLHDYTRCSICGVPNYVIRRLYDQGYGWLHGKQRDNRRLSLDHIDPQGEETRENLRPLCFGCNWKRNKRKHTDEEVLRWARRLWPKKIGERIRMLWWLNTHVENGVAVGGSLFRSEAAEKIERRVSGEES